MRRQPKKELAKPSGGALDITPQMAAMNGRSKAVKVSSREIRSG
jgi:hypothetical protein